MPPTISATATTFAFPSKRLDMLDQDEAEDRRRQETDQNVANEAPSRPGSRLNSPSSTAQKVRQ